MGSSIQKTSWHGLEALALENEVVQVVTVPELGAKLVSLVDKRSGNEWLVGPGDRPVKPAPYGAVFTDQDMSGWDEMFPTILACAYPGPGENHGVSLPDHGEVWALPWVVDQTREGRLSLYVEGKALPYRLARTLEFTESHVLRFSYQLENLGRERMLYIWAAHPQFICSRGAQVVFPPNVTEVLNTTGEDWGWGSPETPWDWPEALRADGSPVRMDQVGSPELKAGRKFFVPPQVRAKWAGLIRQPEGDWLRMEWDPDRVPYLGLWIDEGAFSHTSVAAPEPTTGYYDSLAIAWNKKEVTMIEPGAVHFWDLSLRLGTEGQPFPYDSSQ